MPPAVPIEGDVSPEDIQRFWIKTKRSDRYQEIDDGRSYCIEWTAATNGGYRDQYGVFRFNGRNVYAHRFAYYIEYDQDPGPSTDHLCHNPLCVNVDHLRGGSIQDNNLNRRPVISEYCINKHERNDYNTYINPNNGKRTCRECNRIRDRERQEEKWKKERETFTNSSEMRDFASDPKLNWEKVREIRRLYERPEWSQRKLARKFNISQPMIGYIVRNEAWIEDEDSHS